MKRPFYSIIISCYNPGDYINTILDSIVQQEIEDDIEVIISDDHSTVPYFDKVEKYKNVLNIKIVSTDYNKCPGNTRQRGAENATGEWLIFADQDDAFFPGSLKKIKIEIKDSNEEYYVITPLVIGDLNSGEIERIKDGQCGLTHGKFINNDNLWKAGNLSYKKDMMTHEDIYLTSNVLCYLHSINRSALVINEPVYIWYYHSDSLSQQSYFMEKNFKDYFDSTIYVYLDYYNKKKINKEYAYIMILQTIGYTYFFINNFIFNNPDNWNKDNLNIYTKRIINQVKEIFSITNKDIYDYLSKDKGLLFHQIYMFALESSTFMIPNISLIDFLEYCSPDNTLRKVI